MNDDSAIAIDDEGVPPATTVSSTMSYVAHVALPPGVSQVDFEAALATGREKGHLTQAELIEALHSVELTADVL